MSETFKRCAIYTRKSFDPPIGQELTSLDSQRKVCSAYITSQHHRGWIEIAKGFDDSGRTGANTDREGLQELLADVEAGLIDVVLVYKLDRLTRTLFDFVRLMDFLERHNVSLVSITQNFDTSDSLGRLVLNVLLTFAQFEREITSDRMKDRIKVWKQMGRWGGGNPPLGYDSIKGKLIPNALEASAVRLAFETYLQTKSTEKVYRKLRDAGCRRKHWKSRTGNQYGGQAISLSSLHHILRNPVYVGRIRHLDQTYEGIHKPLIDLHTFEKVQELLRTHSVRHPRRIENLLTGLLFDSAGRPMCVKDTTYGDRNFRYYISNVSAWAKRRKLKRMRSNADELEGLVVASLRTFLSDRERLRAALLDHRIHGPQLDAMVRQGSTGAVRLTDLSILRLRDVLHGLLQRVELSPDRVVIVLWIEELRRYLAWDGIGVLGKDEPARLRNSAVHFLQADAAVVRATKLYALPISARDETKKPNHNLLRLLVQADAAKTLMNERRDLDIVGLAQAYGCTTARFSRLVRLNYLAPDIALAIRDGSQPEGLTSRVLSRADLPLDWAVQRTLFGFSPQPEHFRNPNAASASIDADPRWPASDGGADGPRGLSDRDEEGQADGQGC